jgi:thiamine biosynthesis protein ThiI
VIDAPMDPITIIIHYSEIGLKKGNRGFFEQKLKNNIENALRDLKAGIRVRFDFGRFLLFLSDGSRLETIVHRLKCVPGIAHFYVAFSGDTDVHVLKEQVYEGIGQREFETFRIDTRRADKSFPLNSMEINRIVGERVFTGLKKKVDLANPDIRCVIEIFNKKVYFSFDRHDGYGGLPVGSSGKVVSLLSSGIDSPVASFRMMTRGCRVVFVHFHSFPYTEKSSYYNAIALAKKLTIYQHQSRIYLVPLAEIQQAIISTAPAKLRLILYRRMMFRLAEIIARREKAKALVTGESVGQVASQTLENIAATSEVVSMPVLRPLIGMDKEVIVEQARELDTFTTSTEPYDDCCSYLVPKNPETRAKLDQVHQAEEKILNKQELVRNALAAAEQELLSIS